MLGKEQVGLLLAGHGFYSSTKGVLHELLVLVFESLLAAYVRNVHTKGKGASRKNRGEYVLGAQYAIR